MATAIDSVELTRVGSGTVMGQLMREYSDSRFDVVGTCERRRAASPDVAR